MHASVNAQYTDVFSDLEHRLAVYRGMQNLSLASLFLYRFVLTQLQV
jgi:hypothetical protein